MAICFFAAMSAFSGSLFKVVWISAFSPSRDVFLPVLVQGIPFEALLFVFAALLVSPLCQGAVDCSGLSAVDCLEEIAANIVLAFVPISLHVAIIFFFFRSAWQCFLGLAMLFFFVRGCSGPVLGFDLGSFWVCSGQSGTNITNPNMGIKPPPKLTTGDRLGGV